MLNIRNYFLPLINSLRNIDTLSQLPILSRDFHSLYRSRLTTKQGYASFTNEQRKIHIKACLKFIMINNYVFHFIMTINLVIWEWADTILHYCGHTDSIFFESQTPIYFESLPLGNARVRSIPDRSKHRGHMSQKAESLDKLLNDYSFLDYYS